MGRVRDVHALHAAKMHRNAAILLKTIPDNAIDLILTDPPYFQVKSNAWDNQWPDVQTFLAWLDEVLFEFWRVLKPSGSLYLFCSPRLASKTELLIAERFEVLNHIVWAKPSGVWNRMRKADLRSFFPATERIIFDEHYGADGYSKGVNGYATKCEQIKRQAFAPLMAYFANARAAAGVTAKEINEATDTQMCSHWFGSSQWALPSEKQYQKLQELFKTKGATLNRTYAELVGEYGNLSKDYADLAREYGDLKTEYELARRPFSVSADVPFTDVWQFGAVQYYRGKHPCEKPQAMLDHAIQTSSRPGDVVLDAFMGSGSTGKSCARLGRKFIGIELEEGTFETTLSDFKQL